MNAKQLVDKNLTVGDQAPDFTLHSFDQQLTLSQLRSHWIVLYFYPKDDTSGCTQESCDFRDKFQDFEKLGCEIIGISRDSLNSHKKFFIKHSLNFELLSDPDGDVCRLYNVWVDKKMYGKVYQGIERSTFLIDPLGIIRFVWRKVKVSGHVEDVYQIFEGFSQKGE